jgi:PAS domain S-box-containing protein
MAHRDLSSRAPMPAILRYGIAVLSVAIGIGLDFYLLRHFDAKLTPFLFAVAVTVWYAGTGPGVLAIVLSVLSLNYFFLQPFFSFNPISYADLVYLTFCAFCALAVGWVSAVRRRTEQELRQARDEVLRDREAKIRRLVDSNIIGIFFSGLKGRVLEANDAFLHLVGHDRDDLVSGRIRWTDLTPPEWRDRDRRALAELTSNTIAQPYEKEFFRKDGSRVPVLIGGALFEEGGDEGVAFVLDFD